jgi:DNA-directed RNA polymerase specialized sigma24 family protein
MRRNNSPSPLCRLRCHPAPAQADRSVKQPFINVKEKVDRFVGRRTGTPDSLQAEMQLQETAVELHKSFKHWWYPKGVYRFKTHEEADEWMTKMLARSSLSKT